MAISIVTMGIDDGTASQSVCDKACMAGPWLAATGMTLVFSALFSKIWRLHSVFKNAMRFQRVEVQAKDVMLPLVVMLSLNFLFLTIWTVLDPLYFERVDSGRTGSGDKISYGRCTSDGVVSDAMLFLIVAVNMLAIVLANFQAYQARKISTEYSESKWIAFCMVSILQATMIGTPILILASTNPTANFIVWSMLVFVICMSILGLLFVPKVYSQNRPPKPKVHVRNGYNATFVVQPSRHRTSSSQARASASQLGESKSYIEFTANMVDPDESASGAPSSPAPPRRASVGLDDKGGGKERANQRQESSTSIDLQSITARTDATNTSSDSGAFPPKKDPVVRFAVDHAGEINNC